MELRGTLVVAPPLLTAGPATGPEIVWREGRQAARATPDAPRAASAKADAPASNAAREASRTGPDADEPNALRKRRGAFAQWRASADGLARLPVEDGSHHHGTFL